MSSHDQGLIAELERKAISMRRSIIHMLHTAHSGHAGGSLSAVEIITSLYFHHLNIKPENPDWHNRDRFVLSKGHAVPALYFALAERGFFPIHMLSTLRRVGSLLQGHPDMKKTPGVDMTSGSLGQGLSVAIGMALGIRLLAGTSRVYVLLGDGELDEGQVWEGAMSAVHYKIENLTAILDFNGVQLDGTTKEIMSLGDVFGKWHSFGWEVMEIDGHSISEVVDALDRATKVKGKPVIIVAGTVKGKGVSFMEGQFEWHGKVISSDEAARALKELKQ